MTVGSHLKTALCFITGKEILLYRQKIIKEEGPQADLSWYGAQIPIADPHLKRLREEWEIVSA